MKTIYLNHCSQCGKELTDEEKAYSDTHDCVTYLLSRVAELEKDDKKTTVSGSPIHVITEKQQNINY